MNMDKLTKKSQEALTAAHSIAVAMHHQELFPMHLFAALLQQDEGLIPSLLQKMEIAESEVQRAVTDELNKIPAVQGEGLQTYMSRSLTAVLTEAEKQSKKLKLS